MKFQMIFEGVDRATKTMKKIMSAEKKAAQSMKAGAASSERANNAAARSAGTLARAYQRVQSVSQAAFSKVVSGAKSAITAVSKLQQKLQALGKIGVDQVRSGAGKVFQGLTVVAGFAVAAVGGAGLAANQLVGVASQFEKFQTILETTEGSAAKAKAAMKWVTEFSAKTPYELEGVMEAFVALRSYGLDPTNGMLRTLGDTSSAMGKPLMQAVEAMADAVTGENERLKEFGITASKTGDEITYTWTNAAGKQLQASVQAGNRMAIQQKLLEIFNEKYAGSMDKLSRTWEGMVSNLWDIWSQFQLAIMNAGLFDWMKGKLQMVLDTLNQMKADGTLDAWAKDISERIKSVLVGAWEFGKRLWAILKQLKRYLQMAADYVSGWENLAKVLAAIAFAPTLISTAAGLVQIATGLGMLASALAGMSLTSGILAAAKGITALGAALRVLGMALMANPIVLIIAAIAAGALLIYTYWDPIKAFFIDLWNSISSAAQAAWPAIQSAITSAWEAIKALFAWTPLGIIVNNWSTIKTALSTALEAAKAAAALAWEGLKTLFDWSPLGIIVNNWATIKGAIAAALEGAKAAASLAWEGIKSIFSWTPIGVIVTNWGAIKGSLSAAVSAGEQVVTVIWNRIKALFSWNPVETIKAAWAGISDAVGGFIDDAASKAEAAWARVQAAFSFGDETSTKAITVTDPATIQAAAQATANLKADMERVAAVDTGPAMKRLAALQQSAEHTMFAVTSSVSNARAWMDTQSFYPQGAALMDTMAAGIRARAAAVIEAVQSVTQQIRDHLPSSPAKVGPLSDIHRLKFGETIASSIRSAPMVKAMRAASAATMAAASISTPEVAAAGSRASVATAMATSSTATAAASGRAGGSSLHYSPNITVQGASERDKADFANLLKQHAREIETIVGEQQRRKTRREF